MYLATFFAQLLCVLLLQSFTAAPLLHQQSDIIEADVGPTFFDPKKLRKTHCCLMQAVKYPEQVTGPTQTDTHIHTYWQFWTCFWKLHTARPSDLCCLVAVVTQSFDDVLLKS